jgi:hypothetical protein
MPTCADLSSAVSTVVTFVMYDSQPSVRPQQEDPATRPLCFCLCVFFRSSVSLPLLFSRYIFSSFFLTHPSLVTISTPPEQQRQQLIQCLHVPICCGGVVVSVLATGPKGRGFKPGRGDGFLRAIKICSTPSFGWEVKPEVPCRKILRHVEDPLRHFTCWQAKFSPLRPSIPPNCPRCLLVGLPQSSGGWVRNCAQPAWLSTLTYHPEDEQ